MQSWSEVYQEKLIQPKNLEKQTRLIRDSNRTIATLNGTFDLLHAGHLHMIYEASQVADLLIVALNSDFSIQQYKSPSRPIITLEYRMQMMAALGFVDYVTYFDETDPLRILSIIQPDVHVNGSEYGKKCIEAEIVESNGGKIHIVNLVPGLSTSNIINKIQTQETHAPNTHI